MSSNKVTAVIITGTAEQVSNLINNSYHKITDAKIIFSDNPSTQNPIKYRYPRPTTNKSYAFLKKHEKRLVDKFIADKQNFKFGDLVDFIRSSKSLYYTPSNAALSNYLSAKSYMRHQIVMNDDTSFYRWEKV